MISIFPAWLLFPAVLAIELCLLAGLAWAFHERVRPAGWRRTIWQTCLLAALALPLAEFAGLRSQLATWHDGTFRGSKQQISSITSIPPVEAEPNAFTRPPGPGKISLPASTAQPSSARQNFSSDAGKQPVVRFSGISAAPRNDLASEPFPVACLGLIWSIGIAILLARSVLYRLLLGACHRKWRAVEDGTLHDSVLHFSRQLGISNAVRLLESESLSTPVAFGILRPTVALPTNFSTRFNDREREAILLHELAHLSAHDSAWNFLAEIVTAIFWWHPLSWWMAARSRAANECAADDASLLLANGPGILAECLVTIGSNLSRRQPFPGMGMAGSGFQSALGQRVERLIHLKQTAWVPPNTPRMGIARFAGPITLVLALILCTAWVIPRASTKGENMQTMTRTWKRSLFAASLIAALGGQNNNLIADQVPLPPGYVTGSPGAPGSSGVTGFGASIAPVTAVAGGPPGAGVPAPAGVPGEGSAFGGFPGSMRAGAQPALAGKSKQRLAVEARLEKIVLDDVKFDGLPLSEVVKYLVETSVEQDPEKVGINFVLNRESPPSPVGLSIDPTTGLPLAAVAMEAVDLNNVTVKLDPPLHHIRLLDLLDAITKVADTPIQFTIQDYGVVISAAAPKASPMAMPAMPSVDLQVRTFLVDTNTFFPGLEKAFGIKMDASPSAKSSKLVQQALRELLSQLGITMDSANKSIFYNDLTGILMVRATSSDLAVVEAAIDTLGGSPHSAQVTAARR